MAEIEFSQHEFESETLGNRRTLWIQRPRPSAGGPVGACIFLDGEYYVAHVRAAGIVDKLQASAAIPPLLTVYVSTIDHEIRWTESFCNPDFAKFVVRELLPWLSDTFALPADGEHVLAGLSLTGLSAAHVALLHPGVFARVLCQSGSFWWNSGQLAEAMLAWPHTPTAFRLSVGAQETAENVDHGKGLMQEQSQRDACRAMRDALLARGHLVSYAEFDGGHDIASWRRDLPEGLAALFAS